MNGPQTGQQWDDFSECGWFLRINPCQFCLSLSFLILRTKSVIVCLFADEIILPSHEIRINLGYLYLDIIDFWFYEWRLIRHRGGLF